MKTKVRVRKYWFIIFSIAVGFSFFSLVPLSAEPPIARPLMLTDIAVGEHAEIACTWLGFVVGRGEVFLREEIRHRSRRVWHVVVKFRTTRFLDLLFPVKDEYHSFIDVESRQSLRFEKTVSQGLYRADEVVEFDHERRVGHYFSRRNKSEKEFKTDALVLDPISAVYWFRSFVPVSVGEQVSIPVNYEESNWNIRVPMVSREQIETGHFGLRNTIRMEPQIANLQEHMGEWNEEHQKMLKGSKITVWMDEDESMRIPLKMSVKVPFIGSVKMYVTDYARSPSAVR